MSTTMITGADGYIGRHIAASLLNRSDDRVLLTVRATDSDEFARKRDTLESVYGTTDRIIIESADLSTDGALDGIDPSGINRILHTAAVTGFGVDKNTAHRVNVMGTQRVRDFARRCPRLERFVSLSTLYAAGRRCGPVDEVPLDDEGFVNHYEWSKWTAEQLLLTPDSPPVTIARLPTIIADEDNGEISQYNAFHSTLKLYFYGLFSLLPGNPKTHLFLSTGQFVVDAVTRLLDADIPNRIYHVCPNVADTATLGESVDLAFEVFQEDQSFRRRRLLRPIACDWDSFQDLVSAGAGISRGPINQALEYVASFAEQAFLEKEFRNSALHQVWPDYHVPRPDQLIGSVCRNLAASRWGRRERT